MPGAAHPTKRWPADRFAEVRRRWVEEGGQVLVMGAEHEAERVRSVAGTQAQTCIEEGFSATLQALGRGVAALGSDSGLTHLAAAAGIPTVVLFGPTTSEDGFWAHGGVHLEAPLSCRPCSRHGGPSCPIGDHACMDQLTVDAAWSALLEARSE
jgi:ADP-heptose:LPS heptosyltransferase